MSERVDGDRELDAWLAREVMGWTEWRKHWVDENNHVLCYTADDGQGGTAFPVWHPTTSHDQAFKVAEKVELWKTHLLYQVRSDSMYCVQSGDHPFTTAREVTIPLAICRAVKAWKEADQ